MNEDQTPLEFLQAVYRNEAVPLAVRMKAAVEALPFVHPKLAVTGIIGGQDIAALLDERLKRIAEARPINGSASAPAPNPQRAPAIPDRRYRRL
jgi:hypothetical protein